MNLGPAASRILLFALSALLAVTPIGIDLDLQHSGFGLTAQTALADDDDGGDDDGGDDDDDGGGRPGGRGGGGRGGDSRNVRGGDGDGRGRNARAIGWPPKWFKQKRPRQTARSSKSRRTAARRARPAAPPPVVAEREIVAIGLSSANLGALTAEGFVVLASREVEGRERIARLRVPAPLDLDAARARLQAFDPTIAADLNHYYRPQAAEADCESDMCQVWQEVGWSAPPDNSCARDVTIGVIDTGVNTEHDVLVGRRLEVAMFREPDAKPSGLKHGTAVVAMLIGAPDSRVPGLLPEARVVVADPFVQASASDERSDAYALVQALDHLVNADAQVINLSLAGPDNVVVADAVRRAQEEDIALVAAVGNAGAQSKPLYPAAYPGVIGVTAVDRQERVYRRAVTGEQVDFSAPGVSIPTAASIRGVRPQSGTSFAAPFVTAAIAASLARDPAATPEMIEQSLADRARDLGEAGRDPVFGWGLLQADGLCEVLSAQSEGTDSPTTEGEWRPATGPIQ